MRKRFTVLFTVSFVLIHLCGSAQKYQAAEAAYKNYVVNPVNGQDSSFIKFIKPYSDSISKVMNEVIGFATVALYRKQPEGLLGNFTADAMRMMGEKKFKRKIDVAVVNYGGLRSYFPKGEITVRNVYEVMPFDNLVVLQELKGHQLKIFLDHTANKGGWSLSGATMRIKDHLADSIYIDGKPLDMNATYIVANADYIANGGDYSDMLKNIPQINIGYVYRDALIEYIREFTKQGKPVTAQIENRVVNADR